MSQSPAKALKVQRYEDGWEAINRMIREDLSWSGRERNCLHVGLRDGTFANISAASGVDFPDDGRAMGVLDVDRDGRPDLVLRNRTAPMARVLQNVWPEPGESLWLKLEGASGNRDAIGARIHVHTGRRVRIKEVQAGNLFLSQSSRWMAFGLPSGGDGEARVTVRWPGGGIQDLGELEAGRRYIVREGEPPRSEPYRSPADYRTGNVEATDPGRGRPAADHPSAVATWLIEPVPAPGFSLPALGPDAKPGGESRVGPETFRGAPLLLHFISTSCAVCLSESPAMRRAEAMVADAGGSFLHLVAGAGREPTALRSFADRLGFRAPVVPADEPTLRAYNVLYRQIRNLRRDLAVPTTFLLDATGAVSRVYRGAARPEALALDVRRIQDPSIDRLDLALEYDGTLYRNTFRRDLIALGNAYLEAGLESLAAETFQRSADSAGAAGADVDSLFNYAVACERAGRIEAAREAYQRVLARSPGSDDARNNLGVLHARGGETPEAERLFREILRHNPAHSEAPLNLGNLLLEQNRIEEALRVFQSAVEADPESALFRRHLGYALYGARRFDVALETLRESLRLDPLDAETHLETAIAFFGMGRLEEARGAAEAGLRLTPENPRLLNALGMAQVRLGEREAGVAAFEHAIRADPRFDRAYLNLARFHEGEGRTEEARAVIERLLAAIPGHPAGRAR